MKLPTATFIVVVIVVIGWIFELPFLHRKPQNAVGSAKRIQAVLTNPSLALNRLRV
jgi:hypothetical protein